MAGVKRGERGSRERGLCCNRKGSRSNGKALEKANNVNQINYYFGVKVGEADGSFIIGLNPGTSETNPLMLSYWLPETSTTNDFPSYCLA